MYYYSAKTNAFYPKELINDYINSGTFPNDAVEVDMASYLKFSSQPPVGKIRGCENGELCWITEPVLKDNELLEQLERQKEKLQDEVSKVILTLQDEVDLGMATYDEKMNLIELKKYRIKLNKANLSDVLNINRPKELMSK